ncbi:MAG: NADH-quinone oxidoreductase subunit NuoF [Anaerolineae bacterium]|nr:NADH-quinone oxidoreductase subunit NuoF [Anaerolineae bacterium]
MKNPIQFTPISPKALELAAKHNGNPEAILEIFQEWQSDHGHLDPDAIRDIARALHIPAEKAHGLATFYTMVKTESQPANTLRICDGPACWLKGAREMLEKGNLDVDWHLERTSCLGLCDRAPAAWQNGTHAGPLNLGNLLALPSPHPDYRIPRNGELRVMLSHIEDIDPWSLDSALESGEYLALESALTPNGAHPPITPEEIIEEVKKAGMRGRGGAGFPVGVKWGFVAQEVRTPKYIVCNADESEPLVFKDRVLMETKPHQILEGMALAAYAVGATEGFIYIRGEYEMQAKLLEHAIHQAEERHYLGANILGTNFSFNVHVHRGAGAYICGEETALLESLEGRRGEPRIRPPYPTESGYHGLPTIVNNVETFASVPHIVLNGADWYTRLSSSTTEGTKLFCLTGHINNPGVFEAPYGLTLRQLINQFGGGMRPDSKFHLALCGGAAGNIIPESLLDVPLDYESGKKGVSLGAGAFLICDQTVSSIALLRELMWFFEHESCGKCTPCRIGTRQTRLLLDRMLAGDRHPDDIDQLRALGELMGNSSFCGLGISTWLPISSALEHFEDEFK